MKSRYVCDMTKGNEVKLLLQFAVPMLIGNIFQQLYNMVDSIIVGRFVGSVALGAVGSVGSLNFLFFSLCAGLGSGIGVLVAQYFGAGADHYVKKIIANAIYISLAAGILMSLISVCFAKPILTVMHTPEENLPYALLYMRIVCGATVVIAGYNMISSILRALGDSKTPLVFLVVSCIVNIVLDLVFVIVCNMGVLGVAVATVIAQLTALVGSVWYAVAKNPYLKLHKEHYQYDSDIVKKCCKIGLPIAAQNALIAFSCVALQSVVNRFGSVVMAAYTATGRVEQLVQQPYGSLSAALSTFAGQNVGANQYDRVRTGYRKSILIILIFSGIMTLVMYLFGRQIIGIFVNDVQVITIGAAALRITAPMYFFLGMIYILRALLNGVGDSAFAMVNGITEVICRVGFAQMLMLIPFIGVWGIWWTNGLTWCVTGIANVIRVKQGKWKTKSVVTH